jgi:class 3 adenylate cyclase
MVIGIHFGRCGGGGRRDVTGDGVNIAARLEYVGKPGAISLSEDAHRQVKARLDLAVTDLGRRNSRTLPSRSGSIRSKSASLLTQSLRRLW